MQFQDLNLNQNILALIDELGFDQPTPIQQRAIPLILKGKDLRASAQTGTGKTAAFLLPTIQRIATTPSSHKAIGPRLLILTPTRELAMQVAKEAERYTQCFPRMKTVCIYGGAPYPPQRRQLAKPHDILVATPGRLIDLMDQGNINLVRLETLVLDEADRMLDMGFIQPVEKIAAATPSNRQTLLFSATLKGAVLSLSNRLMKNPEEVSVIPKDEKHENIEQKVYFTNNAKHKLDLLLHLLTDPTVRQAIIFTSTKRYSEELASDLRSYGHSVSALHGDMNQRQRARTIEKLRSGEQRLLVATDVAARGIDIATISHVYNFDLPRSVEDYTHRIGRTGRAGQNGTAASFASPKDRRVLKEIETFTKQKIEVGVVKGMEPHMSEPEAPKKFGQRAPKRGPSAPFGAPKKDRWEPKEKSTFTKPRETARFVQDDESPAAIKEAPKKFKPQSPKRSHAAPKSGWVSKPREAARFSKDKDSQSFEKESPKKFNAYPPKRNSAAPKSGWVSKERKVFPKSKEGARFSKDGDSQGFAKESPKKFNAYPPKRNAAAPFGAPKKDQWAPKKRTFAKAKDGSRFPQGEKSQITVKESPKKFKVAFPGRKKTK